MLIIDVSALYAHNLGSVGLVGNLKASYTIGSTWGYCIIHLSLFMQMTKKSYSVL